MNIKPIVAAIAGITVASAAFAGGQGPATKAHATAKSGTSAMAAVAQGNSVWPSHTMKLAGGKLLVGAQANIDAYYSSEANFASVPQMKQAAATGSASSIYLHNANLFVGGDMGWAHGRLNIGYFDNDMATSAVGTSSASVTSRNAFTTASSTSVTSRNKFTLDEGYVTFSNFAKSPMYVKLGKFYQNFGTYKAYAMVPSLSQFFEQTQGTGAEAGYAGANGFSASIAGFGGANTSVNTTNNRSHVDDWTINAGYAGKYNGAGFHVKLGFLDNESDLAWRNNVDLTSNFSTLTTSNTSSVFEIDGGVNMNNFDVSANFARLNKDINASAHGGTAVVISKPWALDVDAGYSFNAGNYPSHVGVTYQMTRKAGWLYLPKTRYGADYTLQFNKNVNFSVAYYHDKSYSNGNTTTEVYGNVASSNNLFIGRVSVGI
jgi:hypothetical protein